jgi:hypothetical protein
MREKRSHGAQRPANEAQDVSDSSESAFAFFTQKKSICCHTWPTARSTGKVRIAKVTLVCVR